VSFTTETAKGDPKPQRFIDRYFDDPNIVKKKHMKYLPPPRECPPDVLNTFSGFDIEREAPGADRCIEPILDLVLHLVGGTKVSHQQFVLDWVADMLQQPGLHEMTALVFMSPSQGTGKGTFVKILSKLIGESNFALVTNPDEQLFWRFVPADMDKLLVNLDEASRTVHPQQLKARIANPSISFERKGIDGVITAPHCARYVFTSNSLKCVDIEPSDRRFVMFEPSAARE
jgi:hypothetical protein